MARAGIQSVFFSGHSGCDLFLRVFHSGVDSTSTRYYSRCFIVALLSVFAFAVLFPRSASAAVWPVPASELSPSVGFHETYTAGDRSYAHSGIDIPASADLQISTPAAGTVSFTGAVPSGDSRISGAPVKTTMRAVSIKMADGRTVTLMPFSKVDVKRGEKVIEGQRLGTLAASGDVSSSGPHLHMGLKKDRTYYDPMTLFGMKSATAAAPRKHARTEKAASDPSTVTASAVETAAQATAAEGGQAPAAETDAEAETKPASETPQNAPEALPQTAPTVDEWQPGHVSSGGVTWEPSLQQSSPLAAAAAAMEPITHACAHQAAALVDGLSALSQGTGIPLYVVCLAALALAIAALTVGIWALARWVIPAIGVLWRTGKRQLVRQ